MNRRHVARWSAWMVLAGLVLGVSAGHAQIVLPPAGGSIGGVYIDPEGAVRFREADAKAELDRVRALAKTAGRHESLRFVSLPGVFEQVKRLKAAGEAIPEELRYLGGLTRVQYVPVFPETNDLVLAGPGEAWDATNPLQPLGKATGRPVLQLEDLIVALRLSGGGRGSFTPFGCSIDSDGDVMARVRPVVEQYSRGSRDRMIEEVKRTAGPQKVTVFGAAANTRLAFVTVAADYKMKRMSLGFDPSPVGHAVDNSRAAGNRFWFETAYEPLLVSGERDAYELRGPRLAIKAGALMFDEQGATERAKRWAQRFNERMPSMVANVPLFADLQNIADLSVVAALIRVDGLDQRVGWDLSWTLDPARYAVTEVPVPQTAETLVGMRGGSLVAGGVRVSPMPFVDANARQKDEAGQLGKVKQAYGKVRGSGQGVIWSE